MSSDNNKNSGLFSKIFNRKDKQASTSSTAADTAETVSTMSGETLVPQNHASSTAKTSSAPGDDNNSEDLMSKAQSKSPEELKAYLAQHKEETEAKYRRQGGGIAGGDWVSTQDATAGKFLIFPHSPSARDLLVHASPQRHSEQS